MWSLNTHSEQVDVRVSIHRHNYQAALEPRGRLLLALLNLSAAQRTAKPPTSYVGAKSYLVLACAGQELSYRSMASHVEYGGDALAIKFGLVQPVVLDADAKFARCLNNLVSCAWQALLPAEAAPAGPEDIVKLLSSSACGMDDRFRGYVLEKYSKLEVLAT